MTKNLNFLELDQLIGINKKRAKIVSDEIAIIGFTQIMMKPTHRGWNSNSLIDHISIICLRQLIDCNTNKNLNTDHDMVLMNIRGKEVDIKDEKTFRKNWRNYNI